MGGIHQSIKYSFSRIELFKEVEKKYFSYQEIDSGIKISFPTGFSILIASRDFRQYSTVAYALIAILAVQQSFLFETEKLAPLSDEVMTYFKKSIDLAVISLLQESDKIARKENQFQIEVEHMATAAKALFNNLQPKRTSSIV